MERERIFRRFRVGEIRVIANVATMTVGVDFPMVSCIIDARPTRSEMCFVQTIGRGLRTAPGKDRLIVLDHAGNHIRLGCVTDLHHDRLDAGEPRRAGERAALLGRTPGIDPKRAFPVGPGTEGMCPQAVVDLTGATNRCLRTPDPRDLMVSRCSFHRRESGRPLPERSATPASARAA